MAKRDKRSRALLRNLRKQARKGTLSPLEKKQLLQQEARFRKARGKRRGFGAGLGVGVGAALAAPAVQQLLASGMSSIDIEKMLSGLNDRLKRDKGDSTTEDPANFEGGPNAADNLQSEIQAEADRDASLTEAVQNEELDEENIDDDVVMDARPSETENVLNNPRPGAMEPLAPRPTSSNDLGDRGLVGAPKGAAAMAPENYSLIDQLTDIFDDSRDGSVVMVPEYDEAGNKTGNMIPIQIDEESEATRRIRESYNVPEADGEFEDVGDRGLVGRPTYSEDDIDIMGSRATNPAFRYSDPITNQQVARPIPMEMPSRTDGTVFDPAVTQAARRFLQMREKGGKNPKMADLMKKVRAKYGIR